MILVSILASGIIENVFVQDYFGLLKSDIMIITGIMYLPIIGKKIKTNSDEKELLNGFCLPTTLSGFSDIPSRKL